MKEESYDIEMANRSSDSDFVLETVKTKGDGEVSETNSDEER